MTKHDVIGTGREAGHPQVADDRRIEVTGFRAPHAHGIGIYVDPRDTECDAAEIEAPPPSASGLKIPDFPGMRSGVISDAALE